MYVKEGIIFKPRPDLKMHKNVERESCFIEIINQKSVNDINGVVYRHPCMNAEVFIDDCLVPLTDKLSRQKRNMFICGDFNFNLLNLEMHNGTMNFFEQMLSNFLLPVISKPTKLNNINNTLIDNIFINNISPETRSGNIAIDTPDGHLPSFVLTPRANQYFLPKKHNQYIRHFKNFNPDEFLLDFNGVDWDTVIDSQRNDIDFSMESFCDRFNIILDKHAPMRKVTNKEFKYSFKPWIDSSVTTKIREKNRVLKKICKCKNPYIKNQLKDQFKILRNSIKVLLVTKKKDYYRNYFIRYKTNVKKSGGGKGNS